VAVAVHVPEAGLDEFELVTAMADHQVPGPPAVVQDHAVGPTSKILGLSELFLFTKLFILG
jgi:hypothetical protein